MEASGWAHSLRRACSMLRPSSPPLLRATATAFTPITRTTPRGSTLCLSGWGVVVDRGPTFKSRSSTAFCAIWGGSGCGPLPIPLTGTMEDGDFRKRKGPTGCKQCSISYPTWQLVTPPCPTSLTCENVGHSMSVWYCHPARESAASGLASSPWCILIPTKR
jgi:hypothetical protein